MTVPQFSLTTSTQEVYCTAHYEPAADWVRITWSGFVRSDDGVRGATAYLQLLRTAPCHLLLNDNSGVTGPWFDSLDWLETIWAPQAVQLGLRYVAHVLPTQEFSPVLPPATAFAGEFELQIFSTVADAEQWLASCRGLLYPSKVA
jgi:hypothetical protein